MEIAEGEPYIEPGATDVAVDDFYLYELSLGANAGPFRVSSLSTNRVR